VDFDKDEIIIPRLRNKVFFFVKS